MDRDLPPLSSLVAFQATATSGGVSAAADQLGLTQSAVSRQIKALEIFLGVSLFSRVKNRMQLTDRGSGYLEEITPLLQGLSSATRSVNGSRRNAGVLNIATLSTFGVRWLVPRLESFRRDCPEIALNLVNRSNLFDFALDHLDGAIYFGSAAWPGTVSTPLFKEEVGAVATPDMAQTFQTADQVAQAPLVQVSSRPFAWREWFESAGGQSGACKPALEVETFSMGIAAATAGLGVAVLPLFLVERELKAGDLQVVLGVRRESEGAYHFVSPETKRNWPAIRRFTQWIRQTAEGEPAT